MQGSAMRCGYRAYWTVQRKCRPAQFASLIAPYALVMHRPAERAQLRQGAPKEIPLRDAGKRRIAALCKLSRNAA